MNFAIGDRVCFKYDDSLIYYVENINLSTNQLLLRVVIPRDYCLSFGWDLASNYLLIGNLSNLI